jgi:hypothetical protein
MTKPLFALGVFLAPLFCQEPVGPARYYAPQKERVRAALKRELPSLRAPMPLAVEQSLLPLTSKEIAAVPVHERTPLAGVHRALAVDMAEFGRWEAGPDGRRIWRAAIHSPNAAGLRIEFIGFDVGAGRVWVHDGAAQPTEIDGPYAGRGVFGDGRFWSETIFSSSVTIEYEPDPAAAESYTVPFHVRTVSHIFRDLFDAPVKEAAIPCHVDFSCHPEWAETGRAVARLIFEKDGGSYFCSGTLLNTRNSSFVPFFLTANHCIDSDAVARTVQAFWFYQTGQCNGTPPGTRDLPRSNGSTLLVTGDENQGDFTLLRLASVPDGAFFAGWRPEEMPVDTNLTGVHHPAGDYKRISFGVRTAGPSAAGLLAPGVAYTVRWNQGHTEGGSSGSGLFSSPGVLVGTLTGGLRPPPGGTKCDQNPDFSFYGRFSSYYPSIRDFLEDRTTTPAPPPTTTTGVTALVSGAAQSFSAGPVNNATLLASPSYRIDVPAGAARLVVRLSNTTAGADIDLFVRFGSAPVVSGGRVSSDHSSATAGGDETVIVTPNSVPALRAGTYFISMALFTTGVAVQGTITATVESGTTPPPGGTPNQLTSGVPANFSYPAISNGGTLFSPPFTVVIPQGATRLTVRVATTTPNADVDVFVRFNVAPEVQNSRVVADHAGDSATGNETVTVTSATSPPLRAGTYFIALALFTNGVAVQGTVTATVEGGGGSTNPPPAGQVALTSGAPQNFSLPQVSSATFFSNPIYTIQVPQGATRLTVRLTTNTPNVDVDLYVRYNTAPALQGTTVAADHKGESDTGSESIVITPASSPPLRPGTYYIGLSLFTTGVPVTGSVVALLETGGTTPPPAAGQPVQLTSGAARTFQLPSISSATLFNAPASLYTINVPQNATRLTIRLTTSTPNADIDLFARFGSAPELANSRVTADHSSTSDSGEETIVVTPTSTPALRTGTYYIALASFATGVVVNGSLTATVEVATAPPPPPSGGPASLTSGQPRPFELRPVDDPTLFNLPSSMFTIQVPEGATRLQVRVVTSTPNADVDLYVNQGSAPRVTDGRVQADHRSETDGTGNETIVITPSSTPALRAGAYFIALGLFTTGTAVSGTVTATVDAPNTAPPPTDNRLLTSGQSSTFQMNAVDSPTLFRGASSFRITVPEGATRLNVRVSSADPAVDVDLYVRYEQDIGVDNGSVVADYSSETETGNETINVTASSKPPLRPGTYYIALALYSVGVPASGAITATIDREVPTIRTGRELRPGEPVTFDVPQVSQPTFYAGNSGFYVDVPDGAGALTVRLETTPNEVDLDLFVRRGRAPELQDGRIVADYRSVSDFGSESITITGNSTPPLQPGTYFLALANYTTGAAASARLVAELAGQSASRVELQKESPVLRKQKPPIGEPENGAFRKGVLPEIIPPEVLK